MRESFRDDQDDYSPGVVWLYDTPHRAILIGWLPGFDAQGELIREAVSRALAEGFHTNDIWAYWQSIAAQRGYTSVRTAPETITAETAQDALLDVLRDMITPN